MIDFYETAYATRNRVANGVKSFLYRTYYAQLLNDPNKSKNPLNRAILRYNKEVLNLETNDVNEICDRISEDFSRFALWCKLQYRETTNLSL